MVDFKQVNTDCVEVLHPNRMSQKVPCLVSEPNLGVQLVNGVQLVKVVTI